MERFCDNQKFPELMVRTLCDDDGIRVVDAAYLFAQTTDNEDSVLIAGARLYKDNRVGLLGICAGDDRAAGYPGFSIWKEKLTRLGVPEHAIIGIDIPDGNLNTLTEATALVRESKGRALKTLCVIASPFHQIRCFVSTVSIVLREYPELKVYSKVGCALEWNKRVAHSQMTTMGKRSELIAGELDRINRYHEKGDLVSPDEIINYLDQRD